MAGSRADPTAVPGPGRDLVGYADQPPDVEWPDGSRVAVNFVLNVEEGAEPSMQDGDGFTENRLSDSTVGQLVGRDLASEGLFEYGARVGFWRVTDAFADRSIPLTFFACALALERNRAIADSIRQRVESDGWDVCSHGYRWENHRSMDEEFERARIAAAIASFRSTLGFAPAGWYCRYGPSVNTRRLLVEHGGFEYDSDAYNDELPYWTDVPDAEGRPVNHLVVPYSLTTNDARLLTLTGVQWSELISDAIDVARAGARRRPAIVSIGLHQRLVGQPARFGGLQRVLDHVAGLDDVWLCTRHAVADHWRAHHPPPAVL